MQLCNKVSNGYGIIKYLEWVKWLKVEMLIKKYCNAMDLKIVCE